MPVLGDLPPMPCYRCLTVLTVAAFNFLVACSISACAKIALITAIPHIPLLESSITLFIVIPPMATTGIFTASQISFKVL